MSSKSSQTSSPPPSDKSQDNMASLEIKVNIDLKTIGSERQRRRLQRAANAQKPVVTNGSKEAVIQQKAIKSYEELIKDLMTKSDTNYCQKSARELTQLKRSLNALNASTLKSTKNSKK